MNKYCADLQGGMWFQYNTTTSTWFAKPCCFYKKSYPVTDNIEAEFWNHPELLKERQDNITGSELPLNCITCKKTEENKNYSRRMSFNDRLGTSDVLSDSIIEIDLQVDFSCNLACRICGPALSTFWRKVTPENSINIYSVRGTKDIVKLLETAPIKNLKQIHFQGGEPFLSNTHVQVLNMLKEKIDISKTLLWYHSNGTVKVSDDILRLWEQFRSVEIYFSLDDLGSRMEYQRWPCSWEEIAKNLLWFKDNLPHNGMLNVERTVGVLNARWIEELDAWKKQEFDKTCYGDEINLNFHDCNGIYSLDAISQEYKDEILTTINNDHWVYKRLVNSKVDQTDKIQAMLKHLATHDKIRNQNWREVYPEFIKWYGKYL